MTPRHISSKRVVRLSFAVDLLDVVTNLVVSLFTGSAVVFSEMAQGLADSLGSLLLVVGEQRTKRPRDERHPLGYGREAFFWALLSAVTLGLVGGGLALWRGLQQLLVPEPIAHIGWAYAVLTLAVCSNGYTVVLSARKLAAENGGLRAAFESLDRPLVKNALLRHAIGTLSPVVGIVALVFTQLFDWVLFDAIGALFVTGLIVFTAGVLIGQTRALITGRAVPEDDLDALRAAVLATPEIEAVNRFSAVYSGPTEILVELDLDLVEHLDTTDIEGVLDDIERRLRAAVPTVQEFRVQLNSPLGPPGLPTTRRAARP